MNPYAIIGLLLLSVGAFFYGQHVKDAEWRADVNGEIAEQVKSARLEERKKQEKVNEITQSRNKELLAAANSLADSLVRLQQRATRKDRVSDDTRVHPNCATGAELCREDSEFLARDFARCESERIELISSHAYIKAVQGVSGE